MLSHCSQIYLRALCKYGADAPCYIPVKLLEETMGESLQCEDFKDWSYSIQSLDGSSAIRHHGIDLGQNQTDDAPKE